MVSYSIKNEYLMETIEIGTIHRTCSKTGLGKIIRNKKSYGIKGFYEGEKIAFTFCKKRKDFQNISLLEPALERVPVVCPHFNECGGCPLLGLSIKQQQSEKQKLIGSLYPGETLLPLIENPKSYNYRNKVEFTFSDNLKGEKKLGFITYGSRGFSFNITTCSLIPAWMITARDVTYSVWEKSDLKAFYLPKNEGTLRSLLLRSNQEETAFLIGLVVQDSQEVSKEFLDEWISNLKIAFEKKGELSFYLIEQKALKGQPTTVIQKHLQGPQALAEELVLHLYDQTVKLNLNIRPLSFFQPNTSAAVKLYEKAIEALQLKGHETVLDLYCGTGTLGMIASYFAKEVIGIELSLSSVFDAKEHLTQHQIHNMSVHQGDVKELLPLLQLKKVDCVIVDPPRAGLDMKVIDTLIELSPSKIVYIACNPLTQKDNIQFFKKAGYGIKSVIPVDQFTHTPHLENIVMLEKEEPL